MKTQELKIEAPEGYEVDWENSSNNTIRFKPIEKKITYEDICRELFQNKLYWKFTNAGIPILSNSSNYIISTSKQQLEQLSVLNKLMNVAKYLNGNWEPDWNSPHETKWCLFFDHYNQKITVSNWQMSRYTCVYFKSEELAHQAIDILGEEEVKKALGIFE